MNSQIRAVSSSVEYHLDIHEALAIYNYFSVNFCYTLVRQILLGYYIVR